MVQTADLWEGNNGANRGRLYGPRLQTILAEREMCPASVVVLKVCRQHPAQVTLIEDDDVIEAFATDRSNDALDIGVLHGDRGAMTTCSMAIAWARWRKVGPYDASRSRSKKREIGRASCRAREEHEGAGARGEQ